MKQNPYFFIVGCARSGTTLLQRIMNTHSQLAVLPEIFWITHFVNSRNGPNLDGLITLEMVSTMIQHKRFRELDVEPKDLENLLEEGKPLPCWQFLNGMFDLFRRRQRKPLVGNKTPQYAQNIRVFHARWPQLKFIHLIRDGRDVCLSILNWKKADRTAGKFATWSEDRVTTTALWWRRKVRLGQEAGNLIGQDLYHETRYEAMVLEPEKECRKLCNFLEVSYDPAMLRHHETRSGTDPHPKARSWSPITAGLRDWRTQMTAEDQERFEAAAGDLLSDLGYTRAFLQPSPKSQENACMLYDRFTAEVRASGKLLPSRW